MWLGGVVAHAPCGTGITLLHFGRTLLLQIKIIFFRTQRAVRVDLLRTRASSAGVRLRTCIVNTNSALVR